MRRNLILIFGIFIMVSCKEQVADFIFDASKMSNQTKYFYQYDSEKLTTQIEKDYTIMFGQIVDSMISQTEFVYNDKNLLIQEIAKSDFEEKPTVKIYDYDANDSLISEMTINPENDTTFLEVYKYFPDGKKTASRRFLSLHFDPNQDFMEALENEKLDTSFYMNDYEYIDKLCKTQRQYDINGNLIKTVNFDYNLNKLIKEIHLYYFNDIEMTEKVKFYDNSKSDLNPDFYSLDSKKDTIELCLNEFENGFLTSTTNVFDYGNTIIKTFYEANKEVGMIVIDKILNLKELEAYEYYENGDLKETKNYNE